MRLSQKKEPVPMMERVLSRVLTDHDYNIINIYFNYNPEIYSVDLDYCIEIRILTH